MKNKLLVICGPTATGKTNLALQLIKLLSGKANKDFIGEIISADSRQIYKGMDIGTGKDLPKNTKLRYASPELKRKGIGFYEVGGIRVWGYDLVTPFEEFDISKYLNVVDVVISDIWSRGKLPLLVGGTGFYIKGVVDGISTVGNPKINNLRKSLELKDRDELYEMLATVDPVKAASMNQSDRKNPRRLVRAIEIAQWNLKDFKVGNKNHSRKIKDVLFIGVFLPKEKLIKNIKKRVYERISQGVEDEIGLLLKKDISWNSQAMQSLGYQQWRNYFSGIETRQNVIDKWITSEVKYAKRQVVWFKRDRRINWFDSSETGYEKNIEKVVRKWYSSSSLNSKDN